MSDLTLTSREPEVFYCIIPFYCIKIITSNVDLLKLNAMASGDENAFIKMKGCFVYYA